MTVGQLLKGCSSVELTLWQAYLTEDARHQEERREAAQKEAELKRWVNEV
jgi:hypothetical protein